MKSKTFSFSRKKKKSLVILITPIFPALSYHQNSQSQCSSYWTSHNFQIPLSEVALYSGLLGEFLIDLLELRGIPYKSFTTVLLYASL